MNERVRSGDASRPPVPRDEAAGRADASDPADGQRPGRLWGYVWAAGLVVLATAVGALGRGHFFPTGALMLYLLAIGVTAAQFGRGPSLFASALSVAASAFFFLPPIFSFAVSDERHALTFALMFASALLISGLTLQLRRQGLDARAREERTAALYALSRDLVPAQNEAEVSEVAARHAARTLGPAAAVLLRDEAGGLATAAAVAMPMPLAFVDLAAANQAIEHSRITGRGTEHIPRARITCVPLASATESLGVLAATPPPFQRTGRDQRTFLQAFARHVTMALDRARLAEREKAAVLRARTEEMRSSLLSAVSHDLRTPLGAILGAATTLRDGAGTPLAEEQRLELLDSICQETERLARLVANLLEMTRLEAGAVELNREWVPLEEIVGGALSRVEGLLSGRPVETDLPADLPLVPVDPVLLEQVLVNLLENAGKYTPPGSPIEVRARTHDALVEVEIVDHGPGLDKGLERRVFEKFVRGAGAVRPGAGLGLAICRAIIEAHAGTLVASNAPHGGAVFRFQLPIVGSPPVLSPEAGDEYVEQPRQTA